jgi:mono/diheme cytochrome c family protein
MRVARIRRIAPDAFVLAAFVLAAFVLAALPPVASGAGDEDPVIDGRALLDKNCGRCHAIDRSGASPLAQAPPLREIYRQRPDERLEFEFAEGMGSRHADMPQIQFSSEEIAAILTYLGGISAEP